MPLRKSISLVPDELKDVLQLLDGYEVGDAALSSKRFRDTILARPQTLPLRSFHLRVVGAGGYGGPVAEVFPLNEKYFDPVKYVVSHMVRIPIMCF